MDKNYVENVITQQLEYCKNKEVEAENFIKKYGKTPELKIMYETCRLKAAGGKEACEMLLVSLGFKKLSELVD